MCLCFQAALLPPPPPPLPLPLPLLWRAVWLLLLLVALLLLPPPPAAYGESAMTSSLLFRLPDDSRRAWKPTDEPGAHVDGMRAASVCKIGAARPHKSEVGRCRGRRCYCCHVGGAAMLVVYHSGDVHSNAYSPKQRKHYASIKFSRGWVPRA